MKTIFLESIVNRYASRAFKEPTKIAFDKKKQATLNALRGLPYEYFVEQGVYKVLKENLKPYVFTKDLTEVIGEASAEVSMKYLTNHIFSKNNSEFVIYVDLPHLDFEVDAPDGLKKVKSFIAVHDPSIENSLAILFLLETTEGTFDGDYLLLGADIDPEITLEEAMRRDLSRRDACPTPYSGNLHQAFGAAELEQPEIKDRLYTVLGFALKCLTYIFSGEPDLRDWTATPPKTLSRRDRDKWYTTNKELPSIDCILVGMDWKKPVKYNIAQTTVRFHWRWQPYGENRSKVKLIPIDEHIRIYNKLT